MASTIPSAGAASTCVVTKTCPGTVATPSHFETLTFTNGGGAACVTVTLDSPCTSGTSNDIACAAYSNSFDPANPCVNYLADIGDFTNSPQSFSFSVASNGVFVIVVAGPTNFDCPNYTLRADGFDCPVRLGFGRTSTGSGFAISWPSSANGFSLECTSNLIPPLWLPVTNIPVSSDGNYFVTNSPGTPRAFYRLRKP